MEKSSLLPFLWRSDEDRDVTPFKHDEIMCAQNGNAHNSPSILHDKNALTWTL